MHLKQLKLAGFKSFVDPTVVHFPSQLVAVLGPNGCGKSNIIDAVRWVMGESSAKNLRGESMTDVIFNGSSNRKPVGQASVELVFDNSLGRLVGPFASYGEVAVKRVVTRDGDSNYYLNGSRCRRRDITDIFLGTGAGARGYSIIGQGTISRLIEAKPEELRTFLEEAAGVSKYKERRRETLQRIGQTQENLNRVSDIREELDKQLQRLERQAKAAERYTILKEEEALCRAEIMALKWQDFNGQQQVKQKELYDLALRHEEQQSALTQVQTQKTALIEKSYEVNEQVQNIQKLFYQIGTEVARLEEGIQQHHREQKRLEQDKQQLQSDWQNAQEQVKQDEEQVLYTQQKAQELQAKLALIHKELQENERLLSEAQQQGQSWNEQWQEAQNSCNAVKSDLQIVRVKKQHSEQNRQQLILRLEKLARDKSHLSPEHLEQKQCQLTTEHEELQARQLLVAEQLKSSNEQGARLRLAVHELEKQLQLLQKEFNRQNSDYAALNAVQKAALRGTKTEEGEHPWSKNARLIQQLHVEEEWQLACERVLADDLQAFIVEDFGLIWSQWSEYKKLGINTLTLNEITPNPSHKTRLRDKIQGPLPASLPSLEHIYAAETLAELQQWLPELLNYESIITRDGTWVGVGWIKSLTPAAQEDMGLLARQQKLADLALIVNELQQHMTRTQVERDKQYQALEEVLSCNQELQNELNGVNEALRTSTLGVEKNLQELNHVKQLLANFGTQEEELQQNLEELNSDLCEFAEKVFSLEALLEEHEQRYLQAQAERQKQNHHLSVLQQTVAEMRKHLHQAELEFDRELTKGQQLNDRIKREQERLIILQERLEHLASLCGQAAVPEREMQERLAECVLKHNEVEQQLTQGREQLLQVKVETDDLEKKVQHFELEIKQVHEQMAKVRMQEQELAVRASAIQESLQELNLNAEVLLERIPSGVNQSLREEELISLNEKIKRLGAINLAAIEEFKSEQQRKLYLDEQHADLIEALATLQLAIDKMDKETKTRLETTFNEVNSSFKALFPRLFGGGKAQLELTCDNLLEAGIVVMAQPPGKRNSTIHLLSGGEKAMTAVALVFAIFQLNPSPFCMLDEVDAPLDDVNVGRFCALVKEMSQFVQFLFITHNKVTMELADHLIGVTMREPGVSRLVAVDVKEALTME
ncbi:chromosome segregation protein SMC [Legionella sp. km772]|uniref:chromosome segregation protein SMC n=1 Tax=Legionella sp. km772 TaxID=2498111 RepID=UPI000F8D70CA|nr:chromosome segregation protein SMC [Legionella sp. km772]RUR09524.1 chromosome segregation protein SMC [Legionella sp. km772]